MLAEILASKQEEIKALKKELDFVLIRINPDLKKFQHFQRNN